MIELFGSSLSPYVRKVVLVLEHKRIPYEQDPLSPVVNPSEEFLRISPLRKIPVLRDGDFVLPDSSVICRYLEDAHPEPALYPHDVRKRAFACWLEELSDSKLALSLAAIAGERLFKPVFMKQPTDEANVARVVREELPEPLAYLESVAPRDGYFCGELSIADLSLAAAFTNARYAGYAPDASAHPKLRALLEHVWATPLFSAQLARERAAYPALFPSAG
ncbi:MAG: glutathione S-transferase family protein [Deltaproteobacteria bacterium]|nr:glutathione S-transferase family protein [Deltaproteobacteria bacterium]